MRETEEEEMPGGFWVLSILKSSASVPRRGRTRPAVGLGYSSANNGGQRRFDCKLLKTAQTPL